MEFGIGFLTGGLVSGFAVAKSGAMLKSANNWLHGKLGSAEAAVKREAAAKAELLKSKF